MNYKLLKSRTFWLGIAMYVLNFAPVLSTIVPTQWKPLVDAIITLLMFYTHKDTAIKAGATN